MKHSDKYRNWFDSDKLVSDLMDQAADDIDERDAENERLREEVAEWKQAANAEASERRKSHDEIERLRKALKPFAEIADDYETLHDEDYVSVHRHGIELRHFRAIRSAIQQKESE